MSKSSNNAADDAGAESINAAIRRFKGEPQLRLVAFAHWILQANEHLSRLDEAIKDRGWRSEAAHTEAIFNSALEFSVERSFLLHTRALVGWCDCCGPRIDVTDLTTLCGQLLAWAHRSGAYGPPPPTACLEATLAAAVRAIDRIEVVVGFEANRPDIQQGPFGLWATDDFETIGRKGFEQRVDLSSRPKLRSAFSICFHAQGEKVTAAKFNAAYSGEASAKYQVFQELKKLLSVLGVSVERCQLVEVPKQ